MSGEIRLTITGAEPVNRLLADVQRELAQDGRMGEVYSRGAVQYGRRYEHLVQHRPTQADIHRGRWQTDEDVAESSQTEVVDLLRQMVEKIAAGRGGKIRWAVDRALDLLLKRVKEYPAPPPGSRYIRTYNLYRSWLKERYIR